MHAGRYGHERGHLGPIRVLVVAQRVHHETGVDAQPHPDSLRLAQDPRFWARCQLVLIAVLVHVLLQ